MKSLLLWYAFASFPWSCRDLVSNSTYKIIDRCKSISQRCSKLKGIWYDMIWCDNVDGKCIVVGRWVGDVLCYCCRSVVVRLLWWKNCKCESCWVYVLVHCLTCLFSLVMSLNFLLITLRLFHYLLTWLKEECKFIVCTCNRTFVVRIRLGKGNVWNRIDWKSINVYFRSLLHLTENINVSISTTWYSLSWGGWCVLCYSIVMFPKIGLMVKCWVSIKSMTIYLIPTKVFEGAKK